jgi:hypothetical protein
MTPCNGKIFDISWLSQELLGGSSTLNLSTPEALVGTILQNNSVLPLPKYKYQEAIASVCLVDFRGVVLTPAPCYVYTSKALQMCCFSIDTYCDAFFQHSKAALVKMDLTIEVYI